MTFDWTEKWVSCLCCLIGLPCIPPLAHEGCGGNCYLSVLIPCWPICCWDPNKDKQGQQAIVIQNYGGSPQQGYPQTYQGSPQQGSPQNYGTPQNYGSPQNYQGPPQQETPQNYGSPQNL